MNYKVQMKIINHSSDMMIDMEIIDKKIDLNHKATYRDVVRGIVISGNKILVVYPKDELIYGTPGGGIETNESKEEALKREMLEEVGATQLEIIAYLGKITSYRKKFDEDLNFIPTHHLYLVDIKSWGNQSLIAYEIALGLSYNFMDIDEVIETNEQALLKREQKYLDFYTNQTVLFKTIKKLMMDQKI